MLKPRNVSHRLALAEADMPAFFRKLDAYEGDPSTQAALELLILTAVRPGELRGARWKEINTSRSLRPIPAERIATAHRFRTLLSTCANEAGWNSDVSEKQLAHEDRDDVRGAYNRAQWLSERGKLMQWWADRVDAMR